MHCMPTALLLLLHCCYCFPCLHVVIVTWVPIKVPCSFTSLYLCSEENVCALPTAAIIFPARVLSWLLWLFKNRPIAFSSCDKANDKTNHTRLINQCCMDTQLKNKYHFPWEKLNCLFMIIKRDSTNRKVPVVGRLDYELWECKVKISQNKVPKSILRFYILWNLQHLIFKLLEGFWAKTVFSCKN